MTPTPSSPLAALVRRCAVALLSAVALIAAALSIAAPAQAAGNQYVYWSCHAPDGRATSLVGWSPANNLSGGGYVSSGCTGGDGGGLYGVSYGNAASGGAAGWTYAPPSGLAMHYVDLRRTYQVPSSNADVSNATSGVVFYKNGRYYDSDHVLDTCQRFTGCTASSGADIGFDMGGTGTSFMFDAGCYGDVTGSCNADGNTSWRAYVAVTRAEIHLSDPTDPSVSDSSLKGTAASGSALDGTETLQFDASDSGSGVWQGEVEMDGVVVSPRVTLTTSGSCATLPRSPGITVNEFADPVPCPLSLTSPRLNVDTTKVKNGSHILTVTVRDAAGNSAQTAGRKVTVNNAVPATPTPTATPVPSGGGGTATPTPTPTPVGSTPTPTPTPTRSTGPIGSTLPSGAANGTSGDLASAHFASKKLSSRITLAFGKTKTIKQTLRDGTGKPVIGAVIDVRSGSATGPVIGHATTDLKGSFTYAVTGSAAGTIVVAYAPVVGGTYVDQRSYAVKVEASVTLRASRTSVARGVKVTFTGKVTAGTLPASGARVEIKVRQNGRWYLASVPHTNSAGEFTWSHAFRQASHYAFLAHVLKTDGLQVSPGVSRTVDVTVH